MSQIRYWRKCGVFGLLCASLSTSGCFLPFPAIYPETYDASDFEEFHYRIESDRSCMDSLIPGGVCEATINWQANGDYFVLLEFVVDDQSASTDTFQRAMSESEVESILAVFKGLRMNRSPWPFCLIGVPGVPALPGSGFFLYDAHFRWDDFELIINNCDRARLHPSDALSIRLFLESLVPDHTDEVAESTDE